MLHTAQFREGSYSFVVKHWVISSKQVENACFFCTFWHKSAQFLSISQRNYHTLSAKLKKPCVSAYFPGARSNRSNPISYSFYLIGLLWSGDLRETSKLQNTVSFGSRLSLPKMENTGRAQPALQCCTLHSLERDHTHLWSNIESKVQNELKTHVFCTFWHKSAQFLSISQRNYHTLSAKLKKTLCFAYFPGARSNRSNPISYSFYLIGLLWSGDFEKHPNCKTLSRLGLVCLCPKWKTLVVLNLPCNAAHCTV